MGGRFGSQKARKDAKSAKGGLRIALRLEESIGSDGPWRRVPGGCERFECAGDLAIPCERAEERIV
jgi:hypothetical protein